MSNGLRWAWFALTALALLIWAHMSRYNVRTTTEGATLTWDRWLHRECVVTYRITRCYSATRTWPRAVIR